MPEDPVAIEITMPAIADFPAALIEVPDIRQPDYYSCGACAAQCVGRYFGVGPRSLEKWKEKLGTSLARSTHPYKIIDYLKSLGLEAEEKHYMTLDDLAACWRRGRPVLCMVQDYGERREEGADFAYGHYLTFVGGPVFGYLFFQDSSEDNITKGEESIQAPGKVMVEIDDFLAEWHDKDFDGNKFVRYGIVVGPPVPQVPPYRGQGGSFPGGAA